MRRCAGYCGVLGWEVAIGYHHIAAVLGETKLSGAGFLVGRRFFLRTSGGRIRTAAAIPAGNGKRIRAGVEAWNSKPGAFCRCGAILCQLGQESTPQLFAENLADLLTGLPLADDGVMFVNIGDTYIATPTGERAGEPRIIQGRETGVRHPQADRTEWFRNRGGKKTPGKGAGGGGYSGDGVMNSERRSHLRDMGLKPKDLAGVPFRLAFAMQARGWYWRDNIIWAKTNGMPCSVRDRCAARHESVLMFTKSARYRFFVENDMEPMTETSLSRVARGKVGVMGEYWDNKTEMKYNEKFDRPQRVNKNPSKYAAEGAATKGGVQTFHKAGGVKETGNEYRKQWNFWRGPTAMHSSEIGAHIAPMPVWLARRCVLLATQPGDVVLDPFAGTGTTAQAAAECGRRYVVADYDERLADFLLERAPCERQAGVLV